MRIRVHLSEDVLRVRRFWRKVGGAYIDLGARDA